MKKMTMMMMMMITEELLKGKGVNNAVLGIVTHVSIPEHMILVIMRICPFHQTSKNCFRTSHGA